MISVMGLLLGVGGREGLTMVGSHRELKSKGVDKGEVVGGNGDSSKEA